MKNFILEHNLKKSKVLIIKLLPLQFRMKFLETRLKKVAI